MFDEFGFKEKVTLIGFLIILFSIPVSFTLLKNTQVFKSKADEIKPVKRVASSSATLRPVPSTSPLEELNKLIQASPAPEQTSADSSPTTSTPTPTPLPNLAFGPTLNLKINIEGRPKDKYAGKVFVGIASGNTSTNPAYLLTFSIDFPDSGVFAGLSLAGLNPGSTYTAYIKGAAQIDSKATFVMSPTESTLNSGQALGLITGDLNEDNTVNATDYAIAKNLYGTITSSRVWNPRADFNLDGIINNYDLAYVTKNLGKTGSSGTWFSPPPQATSSGSPSGGYWLYLP